MELLVSRQAETTRMKEQAGRKNKACTKQRRLLPKRSSGEKIPRPAVRTRGCTGCWLLVSV